VKLSAAGLIGDVGAMRDAYTRTQFVVGPIQEVPSGASRVTLEPSVADGDGVPAARLLAGPPERNDARAVELLAARAQEWLVASGARRTATVRYALPAGPSAGQHQAGTCRMGTDPRTSVTDAWGRVWGHEGVTVADGSLHVTNGGVNPVLTILALAWRVGEHLAGELA
jgi:choline dehydrogenase-like flavoprotein